MMVKSVLLVFALVLCRSASALCPAGSIQGLTELSCLQVYAKPLSWVEAEGRCKAQQGHLVSIQTSFANSFLTILTGNVDTATDYWTGGNYNSVSDGQWSWVDGAHWYYTNWASGQPVKGPVCLSFNVGSGQWSSINCNQAKPFICSVPDKNHRGSGGGGRTPPPNLPTPPPPSNCAAGWDYLADTNLCYQILEEYLEVLTSSTYTWSNARTACQNNGGDLVSIPNFSVNAAILTYVLNAQTDSASYVSIGLGYNSSSSDNFSWVDGENANYRYWYTGYPTNADSYGCTYMKVTAPGIGQWINMGCYQYYYTICEREAFEF